MYLGTIESPDRIVKDGLIGYFDAAQLRSWPRTGTTLTNLFGSAPAGSLVNGVSSGNEYGGVLIFDGTDDYINFGSAINNGYNQVGVGMSVCLWYNYEYGVLGSMWLTQCADANINNVGLGILLDVGGGNLDVSSYCLVNNATYVIASTRNVFNAFVPNYVVGTYNSSTGAIAIYKNGVLQTNNVNTPRNIWSDTNANLFIGRSRSSLPQYNGKIYAAHYYNRALTAAEVLQNYNATRGRFRL